MTAGQLEQFLALPGGAVLRDATGMCWVKKWCMVQHAGSLGDYDPSAIVLPYEILWPHDPQRILA